MNRSTETYHSTSWESGPIDVEAMVIPYQRPGSYDEPGSGGEVEIISISSNTTGQTMTLDQFVEMENQARTNLQLRPVTRDYVYDQLSLDIMEQGI